MNGMYVVFFSVVFAVAALGNIYIWRLGAWTLSCPLLRRVYTVLIILLALSYFAGRFGQRVLSYENPVPCALIWIGSFWIAMMLYLGLATLAVDLTVLAAKALSSAGITPPSADTIRHVGGIAGWTAAVLVVCCGAFNAHIRSVREVPVSVQGALPAPLTVVAVTDVHLGLQIGRKELDRMVDRINALNPDIVIIGGDLFDEDLTPVVNGKFGDALSRLRARYGIYAVTGNHEYFSGVRRAVDYMTKHGIRVLQNEVVTAGPVLIAGRNDRVSERMTGLKRPSLAALVQGRDAARPLLVIDHTPSSIDESIAAGADLHISGHTHGGQMWPFNFVTRAMFKVSNGFERFGRTSVYVSSGYGTWGPPVRTGNRPEIVKFVITGK
jgi:predicted MPP superfamily phosphohydrolase